MGASTTFRSKDGLINEVVLCLYKDAEGTLWIGTGGGLNRFKDGKLFAYTRRSGLLDDSIFQILDDDKGNLWMGSNHGIFSIPKQQLSDFTVGKIRSLQSRAYGIEDGLKTNECNGGFQPAGWKTKEGDLLFPIMRGLTVLRRSSLGASSMIPSIILERVKADNRTLDWNSTAEVQPGKGQIEFQYTAPAFTTPQKIEFRYRLEGFDREWVDAGTRRTAYYTNIPQANTGLPSLPLGAMAFGANRVPHFA